MKIQGLLFACMCVMTGVFGQSFQGGVKDTYAVPLAGANVVNLSNQTLTYTNDQGYFSLSQVSPGDSLQISHIGYETQVIAVASVEEPLGIKLEESAVALEEIVISPRIDAINLITAIDLKTQPVNSSQEVLRQVPGLFIGQHAGGGKAEQIFLRGFDIDHGTDIAITVDGLPVNMVSHAHGQGYADLHFVIPETIEEINFGKGPYYADKGNFTTAGYVDFRTKEQLDNSLVKIEAGRFNSQRVVGLFDVLSKTDHSAYAAGEFITTDGPFESPQNFNRLNVMGKYNGLIRNSNKIGLTASHFTSRWDASGQIPTRAVEEGIITRFGAIDNTEGGRTSRTNVLLNYDKYLTDQSFIKSSAYYSNYNFELFSNFTFFLNDPINRDQIKQKENRDIYGAQTAFHHYFSGEKVNGKWQAGLNLRHDRSHNNQLARTLNRTETLELIQFGDIRETNASAFANLSLSLGNWTINPSVRVDHFEYSYQDRLMGASDFETTRKNIVSPKLNVLYSPISAVQFYVKTGKGFHSNDARVAVAQNGREILPAAYGGDAGLIWKPIPKIVVNAAYWYLFLEQEFVLVGDEGIVEPSGKTQRQGLDLSVRYQPLKWLFWNFDANYTLARSLEAPSDENFIPLAPDFTLVSRVSVVHPSGIYGSLNVRHLGNRPATEDNSLVAEGYTILDLNTGYQWKAFDFGIQVQNLLNTEWNETQFATVSRLQHEPTPVEEIHFTPGTPFFLKGVVSVKF